MRSPLARVLILLAVTAAFTGCPHRSPVWSPDGSKLVLLTGKGGEEVDKAASQVWVVEPETGKTLQLSCPDKGVRYLAAAWLDNASLAVFTGKWEGGFVESGSEKVWRAQADGSLWEALKLPPPNETNATKRPPVPIRSGKELALVYPHDAEAVVAVEVETGKELLKLEPAELVGPGPRGGFLASRPQPEDAGTIEIAAFGSDLKVLWRRKLSDLRAGIAGKLSKQPVEIVFNTTSTSELPPRGEEGWVGLTLIFSDVGWKDGIPGYHVKLDAASGEVLSAVRGVGLSGRPSIAGGTLWSVLAPDAKAKLPVRLQTFPAASGKAGTAVPLNGIEKEQVYGYSLDPAGKHFAVSVTGPAPAVLIFTPEAIEKPKTITLKL